MKGMSIKMEKANSLIPAIIQDYESREVLMLAYMNRKSLSESIRKGTTCFWSRSRNKLWNKGETSGNFQKIREIRYDCDGDALLILVDQEGPACHTGNRSCFYRKLKDNPRQAGKNLVFKTSMDLGSRMGILDGIYSVIEKRIEGHAQGSYTFSLHEKGLDEILKKVGEETIEIILASKHQKKKDTIYEIADLFYHLLVLMKEKKITPADISLELESRRK
ncbi:MAG: bifunctional phosphoribosyl-AMP cyclohydrolase/phosphoribosyl-ATP diphosphatase HisIE [Actinobacteria bacterium]|nr:bifunctional phosphoribosyl-AMP cyclohydrolase/phosphoribosyl-ATP diphosphatase HisIE [Actinomycetota bacterium]